MKSPIDQGHFAPRFVATVAVLALINCAFLPWNVTIELMSENGPIENVTILFYYLALGSLCLFAPSKLGKTTLIAISVLLLSCAARELDLHKALFGISILKANFYLHYATPGQIAIALLLLLPIFICIGFLLYRHGRWLHQGVRRHQPAAVTVLSMIMLLAGVKILDRSLGIASEIGGYVSPLYLRAFEQSLEEPLEMAMPLLIVIAVIQARRHSPYL